jgi:hypothetical protein
MAITAIVGDVHGCAAELEELLETLCFAAGRDRLAFVGDLVARGPDTPGVLALARRFGGLVVRGNHEEKLLANRLRGKPLGTEHARVAEQLSKEDWRLLEATPLWLDLPEHGVRIVHAGIPPGTAVDRAPPEALLRMRTIDARGRWSDEPSAGPLWGTRYEGPPHVVFGHNARVEPQLHEWATGIDTSCVYGGQLTAVVLGDGEKMPRGVAVVRTLRSVRARRKYFGGKGSS